jgi:hypothetical protein
MVERIRTDEAIHVAYLATVISELRSLTIKTVDGKTVPGGQMIDPVWNQMIEWHSVTNANFARGQSRENIHARLMKEPNGAALVAGFESLEYQQAAE